MADASANRKRKQSDPDNDTSAEDTIRLAVSTAVQFVNVRFETIQRTAPSIYPHDLDKLQQFVAKVESLKSQPVDLATLFFADFAMLASRWWDSFEVKEGANRIAEWGMTEREVWLVIKADMNSFLTAADITVQDSSKEIKESATKVTIAQIEAVKTMLEISEEDVKIFLDTVRICVFGRVSGSLLLRGLSSMDGKRVYLSERILPFDALIEKYLVRELIQSLYQWMREEKGVICAVKYNAVSLAGRAYTTIEAGDSFVRLVYGDRSPLRPCGLNTGFRQPLV